MREGMVNGFDGTKLYYREFGEGVPVVLCDGIGCDGYVWNRLVHYIDDGYRFINLNYRGHGMSQMPVVESNISITDLCRDVECLLDQLKIDKAVFMGHSMGVQVILEFAHMYPDRVAGLAPVCGSYGEPLSTFSGSSMGAKLIPYIKEAVLRYKDLVALAWQTLVPTELGWLVAINTEVNGDLVDKNDFMPYLQHLGNIDPGLFVSMLYEAQQHTAKHHLHEIKVPTLIVAGEKDSWTPTWLSEEMHDLISNSEMIVLPGCGHTGPIELVDLFNLRVEKFLRDHFPKKAKPKKKPAAKKKAAPKKKTTAKKPAAKKTAKSKKASTTTKKKASPAKKTTKKPADEN